MIKQITIYELLPLLRKGFVAMDKDKSWYWYSNEPEIDTDSGTRWIVNGGLYTDLSNLFNIAPFEDDWGYSLMECGNHIADASKKVEQKGIKKWNSTSTK